MNTSLSRRKRIDLSSARWAAYAAAGLGTVALRPAVQGEIHYSGPVDRGFNGDVKESFPLNNGASLVFSHASMSHFGIGKLTIPSPDGGLFVSVGAFAGDYVTYGGLYLSKLPAGQNLSQLRFTNHCRVATSISSTTRCYGGTIGFGGARNAKFKQRGAGYIGFLFDTGAGVQYGWARIRVSGNPVYRYTLLAYAWGDPGDAIQTGQTSGKSTASRKEGLGSLGQLAFGSIGVKSWREQKLDLLAEVGN